MSGMGRSLYLTENAKNAALNETLSDIIARAMLELLSSSRFSK